MKRSRTIGIGLLGLAFAAAGGLQAQATFDKYAPLRTALAGKKQEALVRAEDARFWAEEYEDILEDPEIDTEEKPALRKSLIQEQNRHQSLQNRADLIQKAIRHLRWIPSEGEVTPEALTEAYHGLDELGVIGKAAWNQLIRDREDSLEALKRDYQEQLEAATETYDGLKTAERATQALLDAINPHRSESTDEEFHVALRLPPIKTAVELGFGLPSRKKDRNAEAQATLIALIGYSQFFWDYYSGDREKLGENQFPSDLTRNIFGVADGGVLTSDAISRNQSSIYYLSDEAKAVFNDRLRTIWGAGGTVVVNRWDQNRARSFHRACQALSTSTDSEKALVPDVQTFQLLDEMDALIAEKEAAAKAIREIHSRFSKAIAAASNFGSRAALSSASYNAEIWARNSRQTTARFGSAQKLLDAQLAESANADWIPDAKGITASAQTLSKTYKRFQAIMDVREELNALLE